MAFSTSKTDTVDRGIKVGFFEQRPRHRLTTKIMLHVTVAGGFLTQTIGKGSRYRLVDDTPYVRRDPIERPVLHVHLNGWIIEDVDGWVYCDLALGAPYL